MTEPMIGTRIGGGHRPRYYASTTDTYDETADLDLIAIEYAMNGERVPLSTPERLHAARLLDDRGVEVKTIAHLLGTSTATVRGWKANGWQRGPAPKQEKRPDPVCGEPRMYRQHLKNGEDCDVCRAANAAADRRYRLTGSTRADA